MSSEKKQILTTDGIPLEVSLKKAEKKNKIKAYRVPILGVKQKFRRLGIDAWLYYETYRVFLEKNIKWCEMSWLLEDNKSILDPMYRLGAHIYKRHRIYEHIITP